MLIGKKYKVEASDGLNVTVYQRHKAKKLGDNIWQPRAYFSTVQDCLKWLVDNEVNETGLKDFRTIVQKQDSLYELIDRLNLSGTKKEPGEVVEYHPQSVYNGATGCNKAGDRESMPVGDVTGQNRHDVTKDVTARITELAGQGLSTRAIAEALRTEGVVISHMTIARKLQGITTL